MTFIILFIVSALISLNAAPHDISLQVSEKSFKYAETLYFQKDYYKSITEFKRFLFFSKNKSLKEEAEIYIGLNYLKGNDFINAKKIFYNISDNIMHSQRERALFRLAETYIIEESAKIKQHRNYYFTPLYFQNQYYQDYIDQYGRNGIYYEEAYKNLIITYFLNFDKYKAFYLINNLSPLDKEQMKLSNDMIAISKKMGDVPQKSPLTALIFSLLIPGTGQIYAGEIKEGLIALLVNASAGFAAYYSFVNYSKLLGGFIGLYEISFYIGNINNAMNAVIKYNENQKNIFRQEIINIYF